MAEPKLKLVPAKCGCDGCYYEDKDNCPGYEKVEGPHKFEACTENGAQKIFVKDEGDNNGATV